MIVLKVAAFMLLILLALVVFIVVAGTIINIAVRIVFWIDDRLDDAFDRRKGKCR